MGIFQRMFGDARPDAPQAPKQSHANRPQWQPLRSDTDLDQLLASSHDRPVLLFKHSTRCSISAVALDRVEKGWVFAEGELEPWFLDLIQYRALSNAIADRLGVQHQSPQAILLRDGKAVYNASHGAIDVPSLQAALAA